MRILGSRRKVKAKGYSGSGSKSDSYGGFVNDDDGDAEFAKPFAAFDDGAFGDFNDNVFDGDGDGDGDGNDFMMSNTNLSIHTNDVGSVASSNWKEDAGSAIAATKRTATSRTRARTRSISNSRPSSRNSNASNSISNSTSNSRPSSHTRPRTRARSRTPIAQMNSNMNGNLNADNLSIASSSMDMNNMNIDMNMNNVEIRPDHEFMMNTSISRNKGNNNNNLVDTLDTTGTGMDTTIGTLTLDLDIKPQLQLHQSSSPLQNDKTVNGADIAWNTNNDNHNDTSYNDNHEQDDEDNDTSLDFSAGAPINTSTSSRQQQEQQQHHHTSGKGKEKKQHKSRKRFKLFSKTFRRKKEEDEHGHGHGHGHGHDQSGDFHDQKTNKSKAKATAPAKDIKVGTGVVDTGADSSSGIGTGMDTKGMTSFVDSSSYEEQCEEDLNKPTSFDGMNGSTWDEIDQSFDGDVDGNFSYQPQDENNEAQDGGYLFSNERVGDNGSEGGADFFQTWGDSFTNSPVDVDVKMNGNLNVNVNLSNGPDGFPSFEVAKDWNPATSQFESFHEAEFAAVNAANSNIAHARVHAKHLLEHDHERDHPHILQWNVKIDGTDEGNDDSFFQDEIPAVFSSPTDEQDELFKAKATSTATSTAEPHALGGIFPPVSTTMNQDRNFASESFLDGPIDVDTMLPFNDGAPIDVDTMKPWRPTRDVQWNSESGANSDITDDNMQVGQVTPNLVPEYPSDHDGLKGLKDSNVHAAETPNNESIDALYEQVDVGNLSETGATSDVSKSKLTLGIMAQISGLIDYSVDEDDNDEDQYGNTYSHEVDETYSESEVEAAARQAVEEHERSSVVEMPSTNVSVSLNDESQGLNINVHPEFVGTSPLSPFNADLSGIENDDSPPFQANLSHIQNQSGDLNLEVDSPIVDHKELVSSRGFDAVGGSKNVQLTHEGNFDTQFHSRKDMTGQGLPTNVHINIETEELSGFFDNEVLPEFSAPKKTISSIKKFWKHKQHDMTVKTDPASTMKSRGIDVEWPNAPTNTSGQVKNRSDFDDNFFENRQQGRNWNVPSNISAQAPPDSSISFATEMSSLCDDSFAITTDGFPSKNGTQKGSRSIGPTSSAKGFFWRSHPSGEGFSPAEIKTRKRSPYSQKKSLCEKDTAKSVDRVIYPVPSSEYEHFAIIGSDKASQAPSRASAPENTRIKKTKKADSKARMSSPVPSWEKVVQLKKSVSEIGSTANVAKIRRSVNEISNTCRETYNNPQDWRKVLQNHTKSPRTIEEIPEEEYEERLENSQPKKSDTDKNTIEPKKEKLRTKSPFLTEVGRRQEILIAKAGSLMAKTSVSKGKKIHENFEMGEKSKNVIIQDIPRTIEKKPLDDDAISVCSSSIADRIKAFEKISGTKNATRGKPSIFTRPEKLNSFSLSKLRNVTNNVGVGGLWS
uniref:Uncharacterized protein n=1 Tax=Chaetoceros debilis TaxID=122233 RepID=A0A7S3QAM1_9STRA